MNSKKPQLAPDVQRPAKLPTPPSPPRSELDDDFAPVAQGDSVRHKLIEVQKQRDALLAAAKAVVDGAEESAFGYVLRVPNAEINALLSAINQCEGGDV